MDNNTELYYMAGLFDGEGCFSIGVTTRPSLHGANAPAIVLSPQVSIGLVQGAVVLNLFLSRFGGMITGPDKNNKTTWYLGRNEDVRYCAETLYPFLRIKQQVSAQFLKALSLFPALQQPVQRKWTKENALQVIEIALTLNPRYRRHPRDKEAVLAEFADVFDRRTGKRPQRTNCKRGHLMDEENSYWAGGKRSCIACLHLRGLGPGRAPAPPKTHCKQGHEFTPENTSITPQGWRSCIACRRLADQRRSPGPRIPKLDPMRDAICARYAQGEPIRALARAYGTTQTTMRNALRRWQVYRHDEDEVRQQQGRHNRTKTHCYQGHEFTPDNTYTSTDGSRHCRACHREYQLKWKHTDAP